MAKNKVLEIIESLSNYKSSQQTMVTIGTFDGVHIGHQQIISRLVAAAKKANKKSVLLTFFPHPRMVLQKDAKIALLSTIKERAALLEKTGLDCLIIHPFSKEFSQLTALDFVRNILCKQLHISKLIIGYDHHFGKNREGTIEQLTEYSHMYDFEVEEIPAQDIDSISVSSTKIRKALALGNVATATSYLGEPYTLTGTVVNGKKLGGTIGFPTANIDIVETYKLIPKTGVYVVQTRYKNKPVFGMMNIGCRPTVSGTHQTIEVHFFDFNQTLYGERISLELLCFLRDEQKFESVDALVTQLHKDEVSARKHLNDL